MPLIINFKIYEGLNYIPLFFFIAGSRVVDTRQAEGEDAGPDWLAWKKVLFNKFIYLFTLFNDNSSFGEIGVLVLMPNETIKTSKEQRTTSILHFQV